MCKGNCGNCKKDSLQNEVLTELARVWDKHPNLRLCQLIVNATNCTDPFYKTDKDLLDDLTNYDDPRKVPSDETEG